jgi:hypothetical protein
VITENDQQVVGSESVDDPPYASISEGEDVGAAGGVLLVPGKIYLFRESCVRARGGWTGTARSGGSESGRSQS